MRLVVVVAALAACKSSTPPAAAPAEAAPPAMCSGQGAAPPANTAHGGPMELQLSPAFLDKMAACRAVDATVPAALVDAAAGAVNDKGDCAWANGVTCHFHYGVEFVATNVPRPKLAELHCIFPVASDPKSPTVYGTHFACKAGTALGAPRTPAQTGAACGAGLLAQLAAMTASCDARCCDDGTLTNTTEARRTAGTLDVRPDFRICSAPAELDCAGLAALAGRSANAPIYGDPIEVAL